ncbi:MULTISPECIES: M15 family metallopeptidase [unclassified Synechococcus]|uniref:M15 family metallopeptidase n=1 Tax=unclassified Synechococcus TaxID=2626047 RepID=UPI002AD27CD9|nr:MULTISPECIES: M15 family metallopeptidase [unclassified Synechococcus]MEA5422969.1 M15 family metallopeptidase [Synechococcus sp. CCY9202]
MPAPVIGEDIPLARRSPATLARRPSKRTAFVGLVLGLIGATAVLLLVPGPWRRWLEPLPVEGLNARLSADGRLLGHHPYPEVPRDQLVELELSPGLELKPEAAAAVGAMQRAAAADGVDLVVLSAFRSIALQKSIFFDIKAERNQSAQERARVSAPPGFSEHSTGYAVDLGDGRDPATNLSEAFDRTEAFRWLQANAARFHFQLSFPQNNPQGVSYEPWHWRFEGSADALKLFEPAQRLAR